MHYWKSGILRIHTGKLVFPKVRPSPLLSSRDWLGPSRQTWKGDENDEDE